jgi:TonB family protein
MLRRLRDSAPFGMSAFLHGLLLGCLAMARLQPAGDAGSPYDQEIRPYEKHLVWYNLKQKLPDVSPSKAKADKRPLRARAKFQQNLVAGEKDLPLPPQLIRVPQPKIDLLRALALPNVLAVAPPPKPVRQFHAPPATPKPLPPAPLLPEAPRIAADMSPGTAPFDTALPKPKPRAFAPPPSRKALPPSKSTELPDAPELRATAPKLAAPLIPRGFTPPPPKPGTQPQAAPAEAPPPAMSALAPAPATLAIVGLSPANRPDVPPPPGSHDAAFSGGPELHPKGANEAPAENAAVTVPGLVARGGPKDSPSSSLMSVFAPLERQALAMNKAAPPPAAPAPRHATPLAAHVSSAPDPRLNGRYIYTMAIQMPNVTSYSGSWIVWFADRDPATREVVEDLSPPVPTRKVDPKYIQTAVEERVEGVVRLSAVIRKDGHVQAVELLQHLDDRLDRTALEALSKWEFEPAVRDGVAVDVDAVFEIPFRLAPRSSR